MHACPNGFTPLTRQKTDMNGKIKTESFLKKGLKYFKLDKYLSYFAGTAEGGVVTNQEIERYQRILAKQPQNVEALLGMGACLMKQGRSPEAGE